MKKTKPASIAFLFVAVGLSAFPEAAVASGHGSGNSGGFVACFDPGATPANAKPISLDLADLWEAKKIYGEKFGQFEEKVRTSEQLQDGFLDTIFQKVRKFAPRKMNEEFTTLFSNAEKTHAFQSGDEGLRAFDDSDDVLKELLPALNLPPNCKFVKAANYFDSPDKLKISIIPLEYLPSGFEKEKVVGILIYHPLRVHEVIYKLARDRAHDADSKRARRITGLLYADWPSDRKRQRVNASMLTRLLGDLWNGNPYLPEDRSPSALHQKR